MTIYYLLIVFLLGSLFGVSQTIDSAGSNDEIYTIVEYMPEFPGGQKAMFEYLGNNIEYPPKAKSKGIQGKVYVNFTITQDGNIVNVKAIKKTHKLLAIEAVRVVQNMPKWSPGVQRGRNVSVSYNLPINFGLKGKKKKRKK